MTPSQRHRLAAMPCDPDRDGMPRRPAGHEARQQGYAIQPRQAWHVQQGTPLSVLQELGGWQSPAMVQRYAHLGAEHLAPWNDRLATHGMKLAQPANDNDQQDARQRAR